MKKIITIIATILAVASCGLLDTDFNFDFTLKADQDVFFSDEPVTITAQLADNVEGDLTFRKADVFLVGENDYVKKVDVSLYEEDEMLHDYTIISFDKDGRFVFSIYGLEPGNYRVSVMLSSLDQERTATCEFAVEY